MCELYDQTVFSMLFNDNEEDAKHDAKHIFEIAKESLMREKEIKDKDMYARKLSSLLTIPLEAEKIRKPKPSK